MDPEDLEDLYEMMPGTNPVTVYARDADSKLLPGVVVGQAERRNVGRREQRLLDSVSSDIAKTVIHLWVVTFATPLEIKGEFVIKEKSGKQWAVVEAQLEMLDTRWRCLCVEYLGRGAN